MSDVTPFDPGFGLASLSRQQLADLGREYMIFEWLRSGAAVAMRVGPDNMAAVAIDEWMGASPNYTRSMRRSLGFSGDDVGTIMKGLQLDVGFAHQHMDVRYVLEDERHGAFWLESCGALLDVEPFGEERVFAMCHHIEDPTFDATAVATNARARIRPIHRPPRQPDGRVPHCHWTIEIDPQVEPVVETPHTLRVGRSRLARLAFERPSDAEPGGWPDYDRPFDPFFQLEDLSHGALVVVCKEFARQTHLLVRSLLLAVEPRIGEAGVRELAQAQWNSAGYLASQRIQHALGMEGDDAAAILRVLQLHPALPPEYARTGFELLEPGRGRFWLEECDALAEGDACTWFALLEKEAANPALDGMVQALNPRARCVPTAPPPGAALAWDVVVDPAAEPAPEPADVAFVRGGGAARIAFARRRPLRP